jgi:hypothetical protein
MICFLTFIIAPSTARQDLNFSKALLVVHSMKIVFTYTAWDRLETGLGHREMHEAVHKPWMVDSNLPK